MGLLSSKHKLQSQSQPLSHSQPLRSQSSSLSSQPSLPSVPSLTPPSQNLSAVHYHCLATLKGHSSGIFSLTLDGKFFYSGSSDGEIRVWSKDQDLCADDNLAALNIVASRNGAVKSLAVVGDKLFTAHQDCKIRVWRIDEDNYIKHQKYNCIATLPTTKDRFLRFFSAKNYVKVRRHKKCTWVHHVDSVSTLAISKDGCFLYSASWDRTFKIWRTSDFRCLESVTNAHDDAINTIALNDEFVYTGSADKKIKAWKKQPGEKKHSLIATMERHKSAVNALALSTDGSVLYSGACDRSILVWKKDDGNNSGEMAVAGALRGHNKAILCLAVVADIVCSGSADNTVRVWRRSGIEKWSYSCLAVFEGHRKAVKCLSVAAIDSKNIKNCGGHQSDPDPGTACLVYSGSLDCDIRTWHVWVPILC